jgi:ribosomal protein S18 acetylase RimI-like enzyme
MYIRPFNESDLEQLVNLTIETFRPFYEEYVRPLLGEELFEHQHGQWRQDYRDENVGRELCLHAIEAMRLTGDVGSPRHDGYRATRSGRLGQARIGAQYATAEGFSQGDVARVIG